MATEEQKEIAYLRAENKYLRRRLATQENDYIPTSESEGEAGQRILAYIEKIRAAEGRTPGQSEIARGANVSKSTADTWLRKMQ